MVKLVGKVVQEADNYLACMVFSQFEVDVYLWFCCGSNKQLLMCPTYIWLELSPKRRDKLRNKMSHLFN